MKRRLAALLAGALLAATTPTARPSDAGLVDTSASPFAKVQGVGLAEVHWTTGFWADRFESCRAHTIPAIGSIMKGTNDSQFFENFRVAAGIVPGRHRGAAFNDGDFYKWLEGACASLAQAPDPALQKEIEGMIDVIARAQRNDGYLDTAILIAGRNGDHTTQPLQDPLNFETYNMGHLLTAACVHYRVTGRTNLLAVARKAADFLDNAFHHPTPELARDAVCPSHYMGMVELYRTTREPRYLELAKKFLALRDLVKDGGDDNQDRIPLDEQTEAEGHAVRANYLYAGAADLCAETGDPALRASLERLWTNVVATKLYVTGGCGALYDGASPDGAKNQKAIGRVHQAYGRNYQLPNLTAHSETCANIGNVLWNWRMFLDTGEARYVDVMELTLYNSVLSGVSLDGANFLYVNPLRHLNTMPAALRWPPTRQPFLSSFCCPPNLVRTIAEVNGCAYAASRDALWVNLYGGSTISTTLPGGAAVKLTQESAYPWDGRARLTVNQSDGRAFALKLRIPGWAGGAAIRVNGQPSGVAAVAGAYAEVRRAWQPGDVVELNLPMAPRLIEANPLVEETLNQVAVQRGPVVYCLETADLPSGTSVMDVMLPETIALHARLDERWSGGMIVLEGRAQLRPAENWAGQLYREVRPVAPQPMDLRLVPYFAWGNRGPGEMTVWIRRGSF